MSEPSSTWDREQVEALARRWYHPLVERRSWMAVLYLFVGTFTAIGAFVALNVVGWLVVGLAVVGIGLLLVRPLFALVDALTRVECAMARWIGVTIERRPVAPLRRLGWHALSDPERWRQVGFIALNVVLGTVIGTVGLLAFSVSLQLLTADPLGGFWFGLGSIEWAVRAVLAAGLIGLAPRIAVVIAGFKAQVTGWFLGVDELAVAQRRVVTLSEQRQEILDAVANERRRIERNLHDGVQQQLVAIGLDLGQAEQHVATDPERARAFIVSAREKVQGSIGELRQLGRGLHPAILADEGIDAALSAVVARSPIPISVHVDSDLDLPTDVAETVYFVANEALANVLKHAKARVASVHVARVAANVRVTVHDDGEGGADATKGTGIAGIRARVNAVDGMWSISSPPGGPTTLVVEIPRHRTPDASER